MASRGFEFAYMLDGSNNTPAIMEFVLAAAADHRMGDLMAVNASGQIARVTGSIAEVTCVMMENVPASAITPGVTTARAAVITKNQAWRCSMNAATTTAVPYATKTLDVANANTIDAGDIINGSMMLIDKSQKDSDGNILAYVAFKNTTV